MARKFNLTLPGGGGGGGGSPRPVPMIGAGTPLVLGLLLRKAQERAERQRADDEALSQMSENERLQELRARNTEEVEELVAQGKGGQVNQAAVGNESVNQDELMDARLVAGQSRAIDKRTRQDEEAVMQRVNKRNRQEQARRIAEIISPLMLSRTRQ